MLAMLPALFQGNPLGCACLLCAFLPAQLVALGTAGVAAPLLAAPAAYAAARSKGHRRVPLLPLMVGVAVPTLVGVTLAVVMALAGTVINCGCLCCTYASFLSFLRDQYHWQGDTAEYYILRRISPAVLYVGFGVTEALVFLSMAAGSGMAGALVGFLTLNNGRDARPTDRAAPDLLSSETEPL